MEECDENGNVTAGTKVVTASNDKSGLITFDELTYKDAGTHYYKISEAAPENPEANIVYRDQLRYTWRLLLHDF